MPCAQHEPEILVSPGARDKKISGAAQRALAEAAERRSRLDENKAAERRSRLDENKAAERRSRLDENKAAERRSRLDENRTAERREVNGRGGLDPARYGDWEVKGIATDF